MKNGMKNEPLLQIVTSDEGVVCPHCDNTTPDVFAKGQVIGFVCDYCNEEFKVIFEGDYNISFAVIDDQGLADEDDAAEDGSADAELGKIAANIDCIANNLIAINNDLKEMSAMVSAMQES